MMYSIPCANFQKNCPPHTSGNSSPEDTALFIEAGATRVLSKPIKADQLRSTLMELIESRHPVSVPSLSRIISPLGLSPRGRSNVGLNFNTTDDR